MKKYGHVIAKLRKQKGLTQQQLGERLHVSYQAISKWENDLSQPDINTIQEMVEIFGVSISDFFDIAEGTEKPTIDKGSEKTKGKSKLSFMQKIDLCNVWAWGGYSHFNFGCLLSASQSFKQANLCKS